MYVRVYRHPWAPTTALFSNITFEISYVSRSQKQALVNAIKYVCNPTLECSHTSQREFAAAKLQKYFDVNKF